ALAMQPKALPDCRGADERDAADIVRLHELKRPNRHHARQGSELLRPVRGDANLDAVVGRLIAGYYAAAQAFDAAEQALLLVAQLALDALLLVPVELAAGVALLLCDGFPGELHDHRDGRLAYAERRPNRCDEVRALHGLRAHRTGVRASQDAESQRNHCDSATLHIHPQSVEMRVRSWASIRRRSRQRAKPYPARYALPRRLPRVTAPLRETEPKLNLLLPAALAASRMPFSAMDSRASAAPYFRFMMPQRLVIRGPQWYPTN